MIPAKVEESEYSSETNVVSDESFGLLPSVQQCIRVFRYSVYGAPIVGQNPYVMLRALTIIFANLTGRLLVSRSICRKRAKVNPQSHL